MGAPEIVLTVSSLRKSYPGVKAVDGIDFVVRKNSCMGILGPNGAGKTTTMEIIEGITVKDEGSILYKGKALGKEFKNEIGIQFQKTALQQFITVREALKLFRSMYRKGMAIEAVVELCGLKKYLKRSVDKLSGGERQRLLLAIALLNDPQIILLDEPTTGLDPHARQFFWGLIQGLQEQGKSILMTTHNIEEAHKLCDDLIIMDQGKIIARGSPQELLAMHFEGSIISFPEEDLPSEAETWEYFFRKQKGSCEFMSTNLDESFAFFAKKKVSLARVSISKPDLEALFIKLTKDSSHV